MFIPALLAHNEEMKSWSLRTDVPLFRAPLRCARICVLAILAVGRYSSGAVAEDSVSIELVGEIEARCRLLQLPATLDLGRLTKSGVQLVPFQIDCNSPFAYEVRSREGGLKSENAVVAAGFAAIIPYTLELRVPTDGGFILDQCNSATLAIALPACGHGNSGSAVAIEQTASLMISWSTSEELVAGVYADVVTVNVSPRI